jgi:hypothetical protein
MTQLRNQPFKNYFLSAKYRHYPGSSNDVLSNNVSTNNFWSKNAKMMFCLTFDLKTFLSNFVLSNDVWSNFVRTLIQALIGPE